MLRFFKISLISLLLATLYFGSYRLWRGPSYMDQCDHPYQVDLPNGILSQLYGPAIAVDRYINEFTTEIKVIG